MPFKTTIIDSLPSISSTNTAHHHSIHHKVQERLGKGTANPNLRLLIEQPTQHGAQCSKSSNFVKSSLSADCTIPISLSSHFTNDLAPLKQQDLLYQQSPFSARYSSSLSTVTSPIIFHNQISQPSRYF